MERVNILIIRLQTRGRFSQSFLTQRRIKKKKKRSLRYNSEEIKKLNIKNIYIISEKKCTYEGVEWSNVTATTNMGLIGKSEGKLQKNCHIRYERFQGHPNPNPHYFVIILSLSLHISRR